MASKVSVSVVIPCYRCSSVIERAILSVARQSVIPNEVILVDDASGDDTLSLLHALKSKYGPDWIRVVELEINQGPGSARNEGWKIAREKYIAFLDADDAWHPEKLNIQYNWMLENPQAALTSHSVFRIKSSKQQTEGGYINCLNLAQEGFENVNLHNQLLSNKFVTSSVMLDRKVPHRFKKNKRHSEDFLLWSEICADGMLCYRSSNNLAFGFKAAYGDGGLSGDIYKMQFGQWSSYVDMFKSGRINSFELSFYCLVSFLRFVRRFVVWRLSCIKKYFGKSQ